MRRSDGFTGTLIIILLGTSFIIGGMLGGLFGGGLILWATAPQRTAAHATPSPFPTETPLPSPTPTQTTPEIVTPTPTAVVIATPSVADVVDRVLPAVVTVINRHHDNFGNAERMVGSGVVVDAAGYIVTNAHVANNAQTLTVTLADGTNYPAKIVTLDTTQDLALLKITADSPLHAVKWGDSNSVRLGQRVLALGSPLGDFPNSVTMGIVSGLNRALAYDDVVLYGLLQTDAAINQGNSGGPLVNMRGEVVGINTFIIRSDHDQSITEGISFAIPASAVKLLSTAWMEHAPDVAGNPPAETSPLPAGQSSP